MSKARDNRRRRQRAARKMHRWKVGRLLGAIARAMPLLADEILNCSTVKKRGTTLYVETVLQ